MPRPRGQTLSGDFIISVAIFLVVLSIVLPLFAQVSDRARTENEQREIEKRSLFVSDAIVKTSGYPSDWNAATVRTLGFLDNGRLNMTKIRFFMEMNYVDAQDALSIPDLNFNISFYDLDGNSLFTGAARSPVAYFYVDHNSVSPHLNSQPVVWDLYYAGTGSPATGNSRNAYTGTKVDMFNSVVGNQTLYKTIIIEEPQLTQAQINVQGLQDFARTGGTLVFIGDADIIGTGFAMSSGISSGTGVVANESYFVAGDEGDTVTFNRTRWYFHNTSADTNIEIFVADSNNPSVAYIARWKYGLGTIYFLTDMVGTVASTPLESSLAIVGGKIEHGVQLDDAATVLVTKRSAILEKDTNEFAKIDFLLWK